jgi:hypothetical protein
MLVSRPSGGGTELPRSRLSAILLVVLAASAPLAAAAGWIPIRERVPNTDLALALVLLVMAFGALARRHLIAVAAVSASIWFEFFDARPFGTLAISHRPDVQTTLVLFVAALLTGEMACRFSLHRRSTRRRAEDLSSVQATAAMLASGEDVATVLETVAAQLAHLLELVDCRFDAVDVNADGLLVARDGTLVSRRDDAPAAVGCRAAIPVWGQGDVIGYYSIEWLPERPPPLESLLVAVTLADQAGAALMAQAPPPVPPAAERDRPGPRLRILSASAGGVGGSSAPEARSRSGGGLLPPRVAAGSG